MPYAAYSVHAGNPSSESTECRRVDKDRPALSIKRVTGKAVVVSRRRLGQSPGKESAIGRGHPEWRPT